MKLDYKILWLDDKMDEFIEDDYHLELEEYLKELGFNPIVKSVAKEEAFFKILDDSFDLIMCDYHLTEKEGRNRDGDQIVSEVRGKSIFTEILFYSARGEVTDTYKLDRITFVETKKMQQTHQEALMIRSKRLIDLTVSKFQHIVTMRGMIMHETSSLDARMLEIIKTSLKSGHFNFDEFSTVIYDEASEQFTKKIAFIEECRRKKNFNKLTKDNFVFSAAYKIKTLSHILNLLGLDDFSQNYQEKINNVRNKFAHSVLHKDQKSGKEYFKHGESGMEFNEELCKEIRTDINTHLENIIELENSI